MLLCVQEQVGGTQHTARNRQETMNALQAEVARLERAQSLQRAADSAINSLQDKISDLKVQSTNFPAFFRDLNIYENERAYRRPQATPSIPSKLRSLVSMYTSHGRRNSK